MKIYWKRNEQTTWKRNFRNIREINGINKRSNWIDKINGSSFNGKVWNWKKERGGKKTKASTILKTYHNEKKSWWNLRNKKWINLILYINPIFYFFNKINFISCLFFSFNRQK